MTDINPTAESARESARQGDGRFGVQEHSAPEVALGGRKLSALGAAWNEAHVADWKARQLAQAEAVRELRLEVPYEATCMRFNVGGAHDPFEKSYIETVQFISGVEDGDVEEDRYDEQQVQDLVSFLDVEWVKDNADEVFRDGTALLAVGPAAEEERIPELTAALSTTQPGTTAYRDALKELAETASYITRARTHLAGYASIVVRADPHGGAPVPLGFRGDKEEWIPFDAVHDTHTKAAAHLRHAASDNARWKPDLANGQYVLPA